MCCDDIIAQCFHFQTALLHAIEEPIQCLKTELKLNRWQDLYAKWLFTNWITGHAKFTLTHLRLIFAVGC